MTAILCYSSRDECCCCGGSATLGGTQQAVRGVATSFLYCSNKCRNDWELHLDREALERQVRLNAEAVGA